jgi:acetoin utilization deacetylase AcuC-like enzyme
MLSAFYSLNDVSRRLPFHLVYHEGYYLPLGAHVFPAQKYELIHNRLLQDGIATEADFLQPEPARDEDILLVHGHDYVERLLTGMITPQEEMQMEVPYSPELGKAFWLAAGGSILATRQAMKEGICFNIGGGFHHACPDHGEGFCVIHDVAVAIRRAQLDGMVKNVMVVDCDVHHGNGTAAIFPPKHGASAPLPSGYMVQRNSSTSSAGSVFTISLHQQHNYPAYKPPSSIDVNLPDGTTDQEYLAWLDNALSSGLRQFTPDLLCYIAGADPYKEDQLGGLALTIEGLKERDRNVFQVAQTRAIPVMVTYAGGYARRVEDTVTIHCNTVLAAKEIAEGQNAVEPRTHKKRGE